MRPEEHANLWKQIHKEHQFTLPASLISTAQREEWLRLQGYWEAQIKKPKTCVHAPKRFVKGKAKGVGQMLKSSFVKSSTIENPPLKGKYVSVNKPVEHKDADKSIQSVAFEKPKAARTINNKTDIGPATKNWGEYYVDLPWDEGIDNYQFIKRYEIKPATKKQ